MTDAWWARLRAMAVVTVALVVVAFLYVAWNEQAYHSRQAGGYDDEFEAGQRMHCQDLRPWFDRR